jgi:hypothetical protein
MFLYSGIIVVVTSLTIACNTLLEIDDVSLLNPDASIQDCHVKSDFSMILSDPVTTTLTHNNPQYPMAPVLDFPIATGTILEIGLFDNIGGQRIVTARGDYQLTPADATGENCGICVLIQVEFTDMDLVTRKFHSDGTGKLVLTKSDSTGLAGEMHSLTLRHVNDADGVTTDVNDGCRIAIDTIKFDMLYSSAVAP